MTQFWKTSTGVQMATSGVHRGQTGGCCLPCDCGQSPLHVEISDASGDPDANIYCTYTAEEGFIPLSCDDFNGTYLLTNYGGYVQCCNWGMGGFYEPASLGSSCDSDVNTFYLTAVICWCYGENFASIYLSAASIVGYGTDVVLSGQKTGFDGSANSLDITMDADISILSSATSCTSTSTPANHCGSATLRMYT